MKTEVEIRERIAALKVLKKNNMNLLSAEEIACVKRAIKELEWILDKRVWW